MSEVKWTKEQLQAIEEKGTNILVAAAAGSGKTAVLVERIIHKIIEEKIDIDKVLVVTFTNSAAAEMRERILEAIYKKLEEEPENQHLQKQITLLNKASICTIHSFCLDVIHNHFYELDLPSNFRIADTTEIDLLKQEVIEDLFEQKYMESDSEFLDLLETYTDYHGDDPLKDLILAIYRFIQSCPFPEKWIQEKVDWFYQEEIEDFKETIWGQVILEEVRMNLEDGILKLERVQKELAKFPECSKFYQTISEDIIQIEEAMNKIDTWDGAYQTINQIKFSTWPRDKKIMLDYKEEAKEIRDNVKDIINKKIKILVSDNTKEIVEDLKKVFPILQKLKNLILEFSHKFVEKKREKNCIDFNDIEHFALKILLDENGNKTEVAKKYEEKFTEIAIDEYQDSNLVQEAILTSISNGNNIFMVGDVKQSIYKFRQARPELFLKKYENYKNKEELKLNKEEQDNLKIQLFRNFRSRNNVLDITNLVFESIMSKELGDINYNENEYLNYGANYPEPEEIQEKQHEGIAELAIIDMKEDDTIMAIKEEVSKIENSNEENNEEEETERIEDDVLEARFVAKKIKELLESGYLVYDRKKGYRHIEAKDIVILLRATSTLAPIYEKELADVELPVFSDSSSSYLESVEIETMLSILKLINNPMQDIPLVVVLRSSIGNFTDNELVTIRLTDRNCNFYEALLKTRISCEETLKNKIEALLEKLEKWREQSEYLPLNELIWQIYLDTGYYQYVGLLPNGAIRQANLKTLFEKAKQYETGSFKGLFHFIHFIEKLKKQNGDLSSAKLIGENANVIRIMSIHKSKGLEFPVVFLCNTHKKFNLKDLNDIILLHQDLGIGPIWIDKDKKIKYPTVSKQAISLKVKQETLSEEERILYVALTRAKEKLIITGRRKDLQKSLQNKKKELETYKIGEDAKIDSKLIKQCNSYLDWLEYVYICHEGKTILLKGRKLELKDIVELKSYKKQDLVKELQIKEEKQEENIQEKIEKEVKKQVEREQNINSTTAQENVFTKQENTLERDDDFKENAHEESENQNNKSVEEIKEMLEWKYQYIVDTKLPTKTSVSKLKQEQAGKLPSLESQKDWEEDTNDKEFTKERNEDSEELQTQMKYLKLEPLENEKETKLTPAQKGTLVHLCIQKLDETKEYQSEDIKKLIKNLVDREIITEVEANEIDVELIYSYTKSSLFKELKQAKEIHKEQPFYINIPAKDVFQEAKEANSEKYVLVQGMIDLYYIDTEGKVHLVDFKTDYVPKGKEKEVAAKYQVQIDIYRKALEQALGKSVTSAEICLANSNWGCVAPGDVS